MNNLFIWQDVVNIGDKTFNLPCRRLCFETEHNSNSKIYINNKKLHLPECIINTFGYDYVDQISSELDECLITLNDDEFMDDNNKRNILESNSCCRIVLDIDRVIREILHSYLTDKTLSSMDEVTKIKILQQLDADFPRMNLCYDSKKINSISEFKSLIEKFIKFDHNMTYSLYYLIIMFCTQASFYYSFSTLYNIYTLHDIGFHILPDEDCPFINIIECKTHIDIVFKKTMKYFNINSQETITKFYTFIVITINLEEEDDGYIFYGKKYVKCSTGSLYWIKENNIIIV